MNVELVAAATLNEAQALIKGGGTQIHQGISVLLHGKAEYQAAGTTGGVNCTPALPYRPPWTPYTLPDLEPPNPNPSPIPNP